MTASILDTIGKPKDRMPIITILGEAGTGKTNLASTMPKPIFIRIEDGLQSIPVANRPDAFPVVDSVDTLFNQISALLQEKHEYKTVVFDSVTKLDRMFEKYIIDNDAKQPKSINQAMGGYGAGLSAVSNLHGRIRKAAGMLNDLGICVVFIAHADTETIELPDTDPYMRYSLRLGKRSLAHYIDDVDVVALVKLETFYTGDGDRKKAVSTGDRVICMNATSSSVTKNRYGVTEDIKFNLGVNPFINIIPTLGDL